MRAAGRALSGTSGPCRLLGKWGAESEVAGDADRLQPWGSKFTRTWLPAVSFSTARRARGYRCQGVVSVASFSVPASPPVPWILSVKFLPHTCSQHTFSYIAENRGQDFSGTSYPQRIATLPMDLIGFGYAAFVTFGSIWGYKRRGGIPSLIAGLFLGALAGYGAYRVSNDKRDVKLSLFTAFFLATMMGVRFKRSKKIMPAGLVAGLSLMMILRLVLLML